MEDAAEITWTLEIEPDPLEVLLVEEVHPEKRIKEITKIPNKAPKLFTQFIRFPPLR